MLIMSTPSTAIFQANLRKNKLRCSLLSTSPAKITETKITCLIYKNFVFVQKKNPHIMKLTNVAKLSI